MPSSLRDYYLSQMGIQAWSQRQPINLQHKKLMIIIDGAEEGDLLYKSQQLLKNMLRSINFTEEDVCVISLLKFDDSTYQDSLIQKIAIIAPKIILFLSRVACKVLLEVETSIDQMRHKLYYYQEIPVVVSFNLKDLLLNPVNKAQAWEDFLWLQSMLV